MATLKRLPQRVHDRGAGSRPRSHSGGGIEAVCGSPYHEVVCPEGPELIR